MITQTNNMQIFEHDGFGKVRVIKKDNEPWFVGKDVCEYFGDKHYRRSLSRLDNDEKGVTQIDTLGGRQKMTIINEPGLYSILFSMYPTKGNIPPEQYKNRVKQINSFKRWVTHEVLPSIRKYGMYATPQTTEDILNDPDIMIELLQKLKQERAEKENLQILNTQKQEIIEVLTPKASYYDLILQSESTLNTTLIAKDYGYSTVKFNQLLSGLGVQYKTGGTWTLYQKYADKGYTQTKTYSYSEKGSATYTCWTQKGRIFLYDLLKTKSILPMIEQETKVS